MPRAKNPHHNKIIELARQRFTALTIARALGMHRTTIQNIIVRARKRDPSIPFPQTDKKYNYLMAALDKELKILLASAAAQRGILPSELLCRAMRALLQEPVVLDNLLDDTPLTGEQND